MKYSDKFIGFPKKIKNFSNNPKITHPNCWNSLYIMPIISSTCRCSNLETIIFDNDSQLSGFFDGAFLKCDSITMVYFGGTKEEQNKISKINAQILLSATCNYYGKSNSFEGEGAVAEGNFWHYAEDGKTPVIWIKETI